MASVPLSCQRHHVDCQLTCICRGVVACHHAGYSLNILNFWPLVWLFPLHPFYASCSGGLASESPIDVRNVASQALEEYDALLHADEPPLALQHPVTRRFCDPEWNGLDDGDEVPLRPFLERLAEGLVEGSEGRSLDWTGWEVGK